MKKRVLFLILISFLVLNFSIVNAQNESIEDAGYDCLKDKVEGNCDSLTFEQQIFSLLAIGECEEEVKENEDFMQNTKLTAQAILALDKSNSNTEEAEEWLISQVMAPESMNWLLQIESLESTTCTVEYEGTNSISVGVNIDKTLSFSSSSACFDLYGDGYWLEIDNDCYGQDFTISCDNSFTTNLLYKKNDGDLLYVSGDTSSSSAGGTTIERVNSLCFTRDFSCDYESTLWSSLVLNLQGYDSNIYLPYLETMKDETENNMYIPEAFLYSLTGDYKGELIATPLPVSGNRYYDTAVVFLPFQEETLSEKSDAITWLEEIQGGDGCWNSGNIRDTAFLLYSFWPKSSLAGGDEGLDCELSGYYCLSPITCSEAGGDVLTEYSETCFGTSVCCTNPAPLESCEDQGGNVCGSEQRCTISLQEASDTSACCLGSCVALVEETECESYVDGICRSSCYSNEEEVEYECGPGSVCCIENIITEKKSYWWIWLLLILIILAVLGMVFKDKLRQLWFKIKANFKKGRGTGGAKPSTKPGYPPRGAPLNRPPLRRPMPARSPAQQAKKPNRPKTDVDDVLKKLREMGK